MAKRLTCTNCQTICGDGPKVVPTFVDDGGGTRERPKTRTWCPCCFVSVRAPLEPTRWGRALLPVKCSQCGWISVARGKVSCPLCGCTRVKVIVPPQVMQAITR